MINIGDNAWLVFFVDVLVTSTLFSIIIGCFAMLFYWVPLRTKYMILRFGLIGIIIIPFISFFIPRYSLPLLVTHNGIHKSHISKITTSVDVESQMLASLQTQPKLLSQTGNNIDGCIISDPTPGHFPRKQFITYDFTFFIIVWVIGCVIHFVWLLLGIINAGSITRRAIRLENETWESSLYNCCNVFHLRRQVRLYMTDEISIPSTWGLTKPNILLPSQAEKWNHEQRQAVLFHECAHIKRLDFLLQLIGRIACSMYWFNPLVRYYFRSMISHHEQFCDDMVLKNNVRASSYAEYLLIFSRSLQPKLLTPIATIGLTRRTNLESRILAILDHSNGKKRVSRMTHIVLSSVLLCFIVASASIQTVIASQKLDQDMVIILNQKSDNVDKTNTSNDSISRMNHPIPSKPREEDTTSSSIKNTKLIKIENVPQNIAITDNKKIIHITTSLETEKITRINDTLKDVENILSTIDEKLGNTNPITRKQLIELVNGIVLLTADDEVVQIKNSENDCNGENLVMVVI